MILDGEVEEWEQVDPAAVAAIPAVTVGIVRGETAPPPAAADACDLVARVEGPPGRIEGPPGRIEGPPGRIGATGDAGWQCFGDEAGVRAWLDVCCESLARAPLALTVLARTLRVTERSSLPDALVVESSAYGVLQDGPEHRRWLAQRDTTRPSARR